MKWAIIHESGEDFDFQALCEWATRRVGGQVAFKSIPARSRGNLLKKLRVLHDLAIDQGFCAVLASADADTTDPSEGRNQVAKGLERGGLKPRPVRPGVPGGQSFFEFDTAHARLRLVMPVKMIEAWLLGDREALARHLRSKKPLGPEGSPEQLAQPKRVLQELFEKRRRRCRPEDAAALARLSNMATVAGRCPSFNALLMALEDLCVE